MLCAARPVGQCAFAGCLRIGALLALCHLTAVAQETGPRHVPEPYLIAERAIVIGPRGSHLPGFGSLAEAIATAASREGGLTIHLLPGDYHLAPQDYSDPTCGNCQDPDQSVPATLGVRISGRRVHLRGQDPAEVRIHTHAGYGLLFEDCQDCRLAGLTVTGGVRDTSGRATDAAVVVRRSRVTIHDCRIVGNIGDSVTVAQTVVGIMGICGREDSHITVTDCEIRRNSWDGIALYRDAYARIENCVIDGVDRGAEGPACGGRGVAIGVTWNARADILGNHVARYWKGIGIFVDAQARVRENVVEEMLTWGIAFWDADRGRPHAEIAWNAVHRTGACGISVTCGLAGGRTGSRIAHNALVRTGTNPKYDSAESYCYQQALALHATQPDLSIADNLFLENREAGDTPGRRDLDMAAFRSNVQPLIKRLAARPATRSATFVLEFGAQ